MKSPTVTLTRKEARQLVRLLGILQDHLESAIETSVVAGETEPREKIDEPHVAKDRRDWRAAEDMVNRLSA